MYYFCFDFFGMKIHEKYIKRCLEIAKNGLGSTAPNPMVGCVIVHKDHIIAEGYTSPYGGAHAEVNAINSVINKSLLKESTLYVTLEPCSHFGKTPPCSDLIIKHQIKTIVIGCLDSNPLVAGKGIERLRASGCEVIVGILEDECKLHHKRFFTYHNKNRPYIILKWAQTTDGFIAPLSKSHKSPVWITNSYSRQLVHKWRAEEQAILIGTNTVLEDNPSLTVRDWYGKNPIRVVVDQNHKLQLTANIFNNQARTIIIGSKNQNLISNTNIETVFIDWKDQANIAKQICGVLKNLNINSIIVEGGHQTLQTFIAENLWDEARVFTGSKIFENGIKAPEFKGRTTYSQFILDDNLTIFLND